MVKFNPFSLKIKQLAVIMTVALLVSIPISILLLNRGVESTHSQLRKNMEQYAAMLGDSSRVAVTFDDKERAKQILEGVESNKAIYLACLYNKQGRLFEFFSNYEKPCPLSPEDLSADDHSTFVVKHIYKKTIAKNNRTLVGKIYIEYSTKQVQDYTKEQIKIFIFVVSIATFMSLIIGLILNRKFSRNIDQIVSASENLPIKVEDFNISTKGDELDKMVYFFSEIKRYVSNLQEEKDEAVEEKEQARKYINSFAKTSRLRLRVIDESVRALPGSFSGGKVDDLRNAINNMEEGLWKELEFLDQPRSTVDLEELINSTFYQMDKGKNFNISTLTVEKDRDSIFVHESALRNLVESVIRFCELSGTGKGPYRLRVIAEESKNSPDEFKISFYYSIDSSSIEKEIPSLIKLDKGKVKSVLFQSKRFANFLDPMHDLTIQVNSDNLRVEIQFSIEGWRMENIKNVE